VISKATSTAASEAMDLSDLVYKIVTNKEKRVLKKALLKPLPKAGFTAAVGSGFNSAFWKRL
jgi:hypothetical protein